MPTIFLSRIRERGSNLDNSWVDRSSTWGIQENRVGHIHEENFFHRQYQCRWEGVWSCISFLVTQFLHSIKNVFPPSVHALAMHFDTMMHAGNLASMNRLNLHKLELMSILLGNERKSFRRQVLGQLKCLLPLQEILSKLKHGQTRQPHHFPDCYKLTK